jgi:hemoglobin
MVNANDRKVAAYGSRQRPTGTLYYQLGEDRLRQLIEAFYDIIEHDALGARLLRLHKLGHGVAHSRTEQFNFLSGFLGGPSLYAQKYGHTNVREMHAHVEIDEQAKDDWLLCMAKAIDQVGLPDPVRSELMRHFTIVASALVNR